jgi:hypothetical protein
VKSVHPTKLASLPALVEPFTGRVQVKATKLTLTYEGVGLLPEVDPYGGHLTVQISVSDDGLPMYRCRYCGWRRVGSRPDHKDAPCVRSAAKALAEQGTQE